MFDLGVLRCVVLPPVAVPRGRYGRLDRGACAACGVRCALGRGTATGHPVSGEERRLADAVCAVAAGVGVPTAPPPSRVVPVWRDAPRTAPHRTAQDFVRVTTGCTFREAATAVRVSLRLRAHRRAGHAEHLCVEAGSPTRLVWMTDPETAAGVTNLCDRAISPRRGGPRFVGGDDATTADRLLDDSHSDPVDITTIERLACTRQTDRHTQTDTPRRTHSDGHTRQCRDPTRRRPGTPPQHQTATHALEKPRTHRTPAEENRKNGGTGNGSSRDHNRSGGGTASNSATSWRAELTTQCR